MDWYGKYHIYFDTWDKCCYGCGEDVCIESIALESNDLLEYHCNCGLEYVFSHDHDFFNVLVESSIPKGPQLLVWGWRKI